MVVARVSERCSTRWPSTYPRDAQGLIMFCGPCFYFMTILFTVGVPSCWTALAWCACQEQRRGAHDVWRPDALRLLNLCCLLCICIWVLLPPDGVYSGHNARRWKTDWEKSPQPIQVRPWTQRVYVLVKYHFASDQTEVALWNKRQAAKRTVYRGCLDVWPSWRAPATLVQFTRSRVVWGLPRFRARWSFLQSRNRHQSGSY